MDSLTLETLKSKRLVRNRWNGGSFDALTEYLHVKTDLLIPG